MVASTLAADRLPLIMGFQRVAENTASGTRQIRCGKGIYVYDTEGREYIEATSSFYVAALGYHHEELLDAIRAQYAELPFYPSGVGRTSEVSVALSERLAARLPVADAHVVFAVSGSEAIDYLVKLLNFQAVARGTPARRRVVARERSYHGGTLAAASLTGLHQAEFGLPLPGFLHVSQPDYHCDRRPGESPGEFSARLAAELEALIAAQPPDTVAAFFAEPVSFSAGLRVPPAGYFPAIAAVLREHRVAFVADEIVTGFGRTGAMFGCETFDLAPDHVTVAKSITGGYFPLSAIGIGADLYADLERGSDRLGSFGHGSTHAAHPVGAAAALKTIEIIERDGLVAHAGAMGEVLERALAPLADHPLVGAVRRVGLAAAVDFLRRDGDDRPVNDLETASALAGRVNAHLLAEGVVGRAANSTVLLAPPLIITSAEVETIATRLARALDAALPVQHAPSG